MHSPILAPLIGLVLWTFVMWGWLYATRLPAIVKNRIVYDPHRPVAEFMAQIPPRVRWKADNYSHLMEQPTLFYAVRLTLAVSGEGGGLNTGLAWAYVALRVLCRTKGSAQPDPGVDQQGRDPLRGLAAGSLALLAMTIDAAIAVF